MLCKTSIAGTLGPVTFLPGGRVGGAAVAAAPLSLLPAQPVSQLTCRGSELVRPDSCARRPAMLARPLLPSPLLLCLLAGPASPAPGPAPQLTLSQQSKVAGGLLAAAAIGAKLAEDECDDVGVRKYLLVCFLTSLLPRSLTAFARFCTTRRSAARTGRGRRCGPARPPSSRSSPPASGATMWR